jgi:hypothetical protein
MSAKLFLEPNQIIPQADFSASEEENGKWKGSQSFWVKKGNFNDLSTRLYFRRGRAPSTLDPNNDGYFDFLKVATTAVDTETGGYTVVRVEYQGYVPPIGSPPYGEKPYMTTSYRGTLKTVPITEHSKFVDHCTPEEKYMLGLLISGDFTLERFGLTIGRWVEREDLSDIETGEPLIEFTTLTSSESESVSYSFQSNESQELARLISKGVVDFEIGTYEYVVRWSATEPITSEDISQLGLIVEPIGSPIKPTGGQRNWKLTTINQEQDGTENPTYTMELVYLLSDKNGWNTTLYSNV